MLTFWQTAVMVFVAELGDKTQILTIALTQKYSMMAVVVGISLATFLLHFVSVYFGQFIGGFIPDKVLGFILGISIIVFGLLFLKEFIDKDDDDDCQDKKVENKFHPVVACAVIFFLAELGDKTMFTTIGLAGKFHDYWPVFWGSSLGLLLADFMAIGLFSYLGKFIPVRYVKVMAGFMFLGFGALSVYNALAI